MSDGAVPEMTESPATEPEGGGAALEESAPSGQIEGNLSPTPAEVSAPGWRGSLPGPLKDHEFLAGYDDDGPGLEKLVNQHLTDQTHIRRKGVPMPNWDEPEDVARFHQALGMPEEASGYETGDMEVPENVAGKYESGIQDALLAMCHKHGLSQRQAQGMMSDYMALDSANETATTERKFEARNENQAALETKWGRAYDANVDFANRALKMAAGGKIDDSVLNMPMPDGGTFGANPIVIGLFAEIGKRMGEGNFVGDKSPGHTPTDPATAREKLAKLERENMPALLDKLHHEHDTIIKQRAALRLAIHGNEEAV